MKTLPGITLLLALSAVLALPVGARAAGGTAIAQPNESQPHESQPMPESVEEPDAPDEDMDSDLKPVEQHPATLPPNLPPSAIPNATGPSAIVPPGGVAVPVNPEAKPEPIKPAPEGPPEGDANYDKVILQGLNKVTARAQEIEAPIGSVIRFGTIEIIAHNCWKSAPDERPENAALLEISEIRQGEAPKQIFLGWMFSSTPGLSALEHPFYDVTVVKCQKEEAAKASKEEPKKPAKDEPAKLPKGMKEIKLPPAKAPAKKPN